MVTTNAERKLKHRMKWRDRGFTEICVRVHKDDKERVRKYVNRLEKQRMREQV
jgi:hypothetical protein